MGSDRPVPRKKRAVVAMIQATVEKIGELKGA